MISKPFLFCGDIDMDSKTIRIDACDSIDINDAVRLRNHLTEQINKVQQPISDELKNISTNSCPKLDI